MSLSYQLSGQRTVSFLIDPKRVIDPKRADGNQPSKAKRVVSPAASEAS